MTGDGDDEYTDDRYNDGDGDDSCSRETDSYLSNTQMCTLLYKDL